MRTLLLVLLALLLTGCPTRPQPRPEPTPPPLQAPAPPPAPAPEVTPEPMLPAAPPAPTPRAAFLGFLDALEADRPQEAWALFSQRSHAAFGITAEQFAGSIFPEMHRAYLGWRQYRFVLDQPVTADLAVVAVMGDRVYEGTTYRNELLAVPLVREQGQWRVAIGAGPALSAGAPPRYGRAGPEERLLSFYAASPKLIQAVRLWLDGSEMAPPQPEGPVPEVMVQVRAPAPFAPGVHTVVALASDREGSPTALGWSFRVGP